MLAASVYGGSNTGLVRKNNEDAFLAQTIWDQWHWLLVVIDGLGGYEGGEIAAAIAQKTIVDSVSSKQGIDCLDVIMQAVVDANNEIYNQRMHLDGKNNMGCVITAAILDLTKNQLHVAHVGDTRLYQWNNNRLNKITHDHSFVGELEDEGRLSESDAMNHPKRNLVDRIVGDELKDIDSSRFIEASIFPVSKGDQFILCSDGLSDMLTSDEISSVIINNISEKKKVLQLIERANQKGGKDNITVVVANITTETNSKKQKRLPQKQTKKKKKRNKINQKDKQRNQISVNNEETKFYKIGFIITTILLIVILLYFFVMHNLK